MACKETPQTPPEQCLAELEKQRARLLRILTSGVEEVEQPVLGRTRYRSLQDVASALRAVNDLIAACPGGSPAPDPNAAMRRRRPIYPVVREV